VYIRPRTPHLNGKVERSHRVDEQEFYQLLDKDGITDDIRLFNDKLREWEDYYNTTGHMEASKGRRPTSDSWQRNTLPGCHRSLETLHPLWMAPRAGFEVRRKLLSAVALQVLDRLDTPSDTPSSSCVLHLL
jgi:hypothetical protein